MIPIVDGVSSASLLAHDRSGMSWIEIALCGQLPHLSYDLVSATIVWHYAKVDLGGGDALLLG